MTPLQIIDHYGQGSILRATRNGLPVSRQTLYDWLQRKTIPGKWQAWIERDTAGVLRADPKAKP